MSKVTDYLSKRPGKEVTIDEMLAAGVAPSTASLQSYLTKLVQDPRSGVRRTGAATRRPGITRAYVYEKPPPAILIELRVIGRTADGNTLAVNDDGILYELKSVGRLDEKLAR